MLYVVLTCIKQAGTAVPDEGSSFAEYRQPKWCKTAYRRPRWYSTLKSKLPKYRKIIPKPACKFENKYRTFLYSYAHKKCRGCIPFWLIGQVSYQDSVLLLLTLFFSRFSTPTTTLLLLRKASSTSKPITSELNNQIVDVLGKLTVGTFHRISCRLTWGE